MAPNAEANGPGRGVVDRRCLSASCFRNDLASSSCRHTGLECAAAAHRAAGCGSRHSAASVTVFVISHASHLKHEASLLLCRAALCNRCTACCPEAVTAPAPETNLNPSIFRSPHLTLLPTCRAGPRSDCTSCCPTQKRSWRRPSRSSSMMRIGCRRARRDWCIVASRCRRQRRWGRSLCASTTRRAFTPTRKLIVVASYRQSVARLLPPQGIEVQMVEGAEGAIPALPTPCVLLTNPRIVLSH